MNYVFLDLEYNQPSDVKSTHYLAKHMKNEIIEIGAVKTDCDLKIVNSFKCYIRPYLQPQINKDVLKLLGFQNQDYINTNGTKFRHAMDLFNYFLGKDEFKFVVWGGSTDTTVLKENCGIWHISYKHLKNKQTIDLQRCYMQLHQLNRTPSLEKVLSNFGIERDLKKLHGALYDSFSTLDIAKKIGVEVFDKPEMFLKKYKTVNPPYDLQDILKKRIHCPQCGRFMPKEEISKTFVLNSKYTKTYKLTSCNHCNVMVAAEIKFDNKDKTEEKKNFIIHNNNDKGIKEIMDKFKFGQIIKI